MDIDSIVLYAKIEDIGKKINQCLKLIEGVLKEESPYPALVRAMANLTGEEKTVLAYMIENGKDVFLLSVHSEEWIREAVFSLARKRVLQTKLNIDCLNQFSSGTFFMVGATFNFLYSNREIFQDFYGEIKSDSDLYKEDECDSLLCKANRFSINQGIPEVTAAQILGDEPLPENIGK